MPRGTKAGSEFRQPEEIDPVTGNVARHARIVVRKRYTDLKGRRREKKRYASTPTEAQNLRKAIDKEIEGELAGVTPTVGVRTFIDLSTYCQERMLKPAEYVGETKVAGLRSWDTVKGQLDTLESFFGAMVMPAIEYDDIEDFKTERLKTPIVTEKWVGTGEDRKLQIKSRPRAIASVNRELALLRRMLRVAQAKKWITENPFNRGEVLIEISLEVKKDRVLTAAEEVRLLAQCTGRRKHLRFPILMAIDTALRQGEQLNMKRMDVDLDEKLMSALSYKGRRAVRRFVPISSYLRPLLEEHLASHNEPTVFTFRDPKRGFATACRLAGITGVTWHSLRHTAITRMVHLYRIDPHEVMKISGHTNWKTFFEVYVNIDEDIARAIGARIDAARAEAAPAVLKSPELSTEVIQ